MEVGVPVAAGVEVGVPVPVGDLDDPEVAGAVRVATAAVVEAEAVPEVGVPEVADLVVGVPVEVEDLEGPEALVAGVAKVVTEVVVGAGRPTGVVETANLEAGVKEVLEDTVEEVKVLEGMVVLEDSPRTLQRHSLLEGSREDFLTELEPGPAREAQMAVAKVASEVDPREAGEAVLVAAAVAVQEEVGEAVLELETHKEAGEEEVGKSSQLQQLFRSFFNCSTLVYLALSSNKYFQKTKCYNIKNSKANL